MGSNWEKLKDHYFTSGKAAGYKCECDVAKLNVKLDVKSCGAETLSLTTQGNKNLFYHTSVPSTTSALHQATSGCNNYATTRISITTATDVHDCLQKCKITNLCTEFFFDKSGTQECHLHKAGCTYTEDGKWDWFKVKTQASTSIGSFYDHYFSVSTTNKFCGIQKFWLGGCDAGGYANTKYTNSATENMFMEE